MVDTLALARGGNSTGRVPGSVLGRYRDVVVISGAHPKYLDLSQSHRGELRAKVQRQDFSIRDPEAGIGFKATTSRNPGGHHSPRHRHNFDQLRFVLEGEVTYAQKNYGPGWLGYFPEAVPYGPHGGTEHREIVMQFPGPSKTPYYTPDQTREGQRRLRDTGATLAEGLCIWPDGRKQDGFEALWELMAGRQIEYPPPRYDLPVWIDTSRFDWEPTDWPGVSIKRVVQFNACGPLVELFKMEPGAVIPAGRTGALAMRFAYDGEIEYRGELCPAVSGLYYPPAAPYDALRSRSGGLVLSVQLQGGGSGPPRST